MKKIVVLFALVAVLATGVGAFANSWDVYFSGEIKIYHKSGSLKETITVTSPDTLNDFPVPALPLLRGEELSVNGSWFMEERGGVMSDDIAGAWTHTRIDFEPGDTSCITFLSNLVKGENVWTNGISYNVLAVADCSVDIELNYIRSEDVLGHDGNYRVSSLDLNPYDFELDLAVEPQPKSSGGGCNAAFAPLALVFLIPLMKGGKIMKKFALIFALLFVVLAAGSALAAQSSEYIGLDKALDVAIAHAGLTRAGVFDVDVDLEVRRGRVIYDVEFETTEFEYDYHIDAKTGEVLRHRKDIND